MLITTVAFGQDERPALPFVGTDVISILNDAGQDELLGGTIEGISGERLTLRTNGKGSLQVLRLSAVSQLSFHRDVAWEEGLQFQEAGKLPEAIVSFDRALGKERRDWAWCELQATIAKAEIRRGQRRRAVERIEEIIEKDDRSRHVSLLPLVWDERLAEDERIVAQPAELQGSTRIRRLVAASALLHDPEYRPAATAVLQRIRQDERLSRIGQLAEAQLWRLHLLDRPNERNAVLQVWADQVREMSIEARTGPQYVVAREFRQAHDYDRAALAFLWMPLMTPSDEPLAALSLVEAIQCLQQAGRVAEAEQMTKELKLRFPDASATRALIQSEANVQKSGG